MDVSILYISTIEKRESKKKQRNSTVAQVMMLLLLVRAYQRSADIEQKMKKKETYARSLTHAYCGVSNRKIIGKYLI